VPIYNNIVVQASILPTIPPIYGLNPSISWHCVGDILSKKEECENKTCGSVRWLKDAKLEDLEGVLVVWMRQVNAKNGTKQMKLLRNKEVRQILCTKTGVCVA
jgi:hypothetical protein